MSEIEVQNLPSLTTETNATKAKRKRPQSRVTAQARKGIATWLENRDKRGPVARRFRDLVGLITADCGGPSALSENQRQIIRRIGALGCWCEGQEAKMADGEEIDIDEFQRTSNSLRRLCESVGIERATRDESSAWDDYLARKASENEGGVRPAARDD